MSGDPTESSLEQLMENINAQLKDGASLVVKPNRLRIPSECIHRDETGRQYYLNLLAERVFL